MHSLLIGGIVVIAIVLRWHWQPGEKTTWNSRWNSALAAFSLPPLLLLSASVTVLVMGHHGSMMGLPVSPVGCWLGRLILGLALAAGVTSLAKILWFQIQLRRYPWIILNSGEQVRCLESDTPFAAQVGFWRSRVVVSRGWLNGLTEIEQSATLNHEQAHAYYQDLLGFWLLGIAHRLTFWLPQTDRLWQELVLLREIRADRWAAQKYDPLLLAELVVKLSRPGIGDYEAQPLAISFGDGTSVELLEQRVEALVNPEFLPETPSPRPQIAWLAFAIGPLMTSLLHS